MVIKPCLHFKFTIKVDKSIIHKNVLTVFIFQIQTYHNY